MYPELSPQQEELLRRVLSYAKANVDDMSEAFEDNIREADIEGLSDILGVTI